VVDRIYAIFWDKSLGITLTISFFFWKWKTNNNAHLYKDSNARIIYGTYTHLTRESHTCIIIIIISIKKFEKKNDIYEVVIM